MPCVTLQNSCHAVKPPSRYRRGYMIKIPFTGNKKNYYRYVKPLVKEYGYKKVFEPFGGSCVLSANLYHEKLVDEAVINDYDRFFDGYEEYLDVKDHIVKECMNYGIRKHYKGHYSYTYDECGNKVRIDSRKLNEDEQAFLQNLVKDLDYSMIEYLALGRNFTGTFALVHKNIKLKDFILFENELSTKKQREFLKVIESMEKVNMDWHDYFNAFGSRIDRSSLLIIDPPYHNVRHERYKGNFTKEDTQELLDTLLQYGADILYFNDDKEQADKWLKENNLTDYDYTFKKYIKQMENKFERVDFMLHVRRS